MSPPAGTASRDTAAVESLRLCCVSCQAVLAMANSNVSPQLSSSSRSCAEVLSVPACTTEEEKEDETPGLTRNGLAWKSKLEPPASSINVAPKPTTLADRLLGIPVALQHLNHN